jgi:uncharacterized membrane protein
MKVDRAGNESWGVRVRGEPRWPATAAVIVAIGLYLSLPQKLVYGPPILLPVLEALLIAPLTIVAPHRNKEESRWQRWAAVALIAIVNVANIASLVLLVNELVNGRQLAGKRILVSALEIWLTNVIVFALWYWELDRGGPDERTATEHRRPDFLFPQMSTPDCADDGWTPNFVDYTYVSFTNATAFSPTDTMPLTPIAKSLMMVQSLASLITVGLVAARAVNILH